MNKQSIIKKTREASNQPGVLGQVAERTEPVRLQSPQVANYLANWKPGASLPVPHPLGALGPLLPFLPRDCSAPCTTSLPRPQKKIK